MSTESPDIPQNMQKVLRRFERWRSAHTGRLPIPKRLRTAAVELAREHGVFHTVAGSFPDECRYVLEALGEVHGHEGTVSEQGLAPPERRRFHQLTGRPVMDAQHAWLSARFEEKRVEPNSGLGEAITYCLKHWERLTLFLRQAGAPLDSNIVERALKKALLHRETTLEKVGKRTAGKANWRRVFSQTFVQGKTPCCVDLYLTTRYACKSPTISLPRIFCGAPAYG